MSRDPVHSRGKLSVSFSVPPELGHGTQWDTDRAFGSLAHRAREEGLSIRRRFADILFPIRPCRVACQITLQRDVEDIDDACEWLFQAVLRGFEDAGLVRDSDGFLELNSDIKAESRTGDADEVTLAFVVESVYDKARTKVARERSRLRERPTAETAALNPRFAVFEHRAFRVAYPRSWYNMTSMMRIPGIEVLVAYSDVARRAGFLGKMTDAMSTRRPQGGFGVLRFSVSDLIDGDAFATIRQAFANRSPHVVTEEKSKFKGKDCSHSIIDALDFNSGKRTRYNFVWVVASQDYGIVLLRWAEIDSLSNYDDTFSMIVESFEVR